MKRGLLAVLISLPVVANAAIHRVPSQFATIQAGIDASAEGDTVLVARGTYTGVGNRNLNFNGTNLVLASEGGPEATIIDCEGQSLGMRFSNGEAASSVVNGFTIENGSSDGGGGIYCHDVAVTFKNLVLQNNYSSASQYGGAGGGMYCYNADVTLTRVRFIGNLAEGWSSSWFGSAWVQGGGLYAYGCAIEMTEVEFWNNLALNDVLGYDECCPAAEGGAAYLSGGPYSIKNSVFVGNTARTEGMDGWASSEGGAIWCNWTTVIENSTFVGNSADHSSALSDGAYAIVRQSIFAYNLEDDAIQLSDPTHVSCCLFWGNAGLDAEFAAAGNNLFVDPQFCGISGSGNYHLQSDSPCLPENNDCGVLIGAFGQGCEETPVALASFTATPAAGAVDLAWEADTLADFRLTGTRAATTWDVAWQAAGSGRFHARDESAQLAPGGEVSYRLEGRLPGEDWQLLRELAVTLPPAFATRLLEPHPNPFNPTVTLPFTLAAPGRVRLEVFDLAGRRIATLADGAFEAGEQALAWDGRDGAGHAQASGVYFARFATVGYTETKRLVLLR